MDEFERLSFKNRDEWRIWLKDYHNIAKGIWLIYYKKHTKKPTVYYNDAVEEALCYGWIDSLVKRIDDERYMQKYTPRNASSSWSAINKKRVKEMIAEGKMTKHGLKMIEIAKQNGKWNEMEIKKRESTLSEDLLSILKNDLDAFDKFEKLSPSHKKNYAMWIMDAKKDETRIRRVKKMITMVKKGQRFM